MPSIFTLTDEPPSQPHPICSLLFGETLKFHKKNSHQHSDEREKKKDISVKIGEARYKIAEIV